MEKGSRKAQSVGSWPLCRAARVAASHEAYAGALAISANLKKCCGLDTYAMCAIWKHLHEIARPQGGETFVPHLKAA
jgi:hypothetical protein